MPSITFSGLASGIDADAVIQATVDARRTGLIPLENEILSNESETAALEEYNTKLLALRDSAKSVMTLTGGAILKSGQSSNQDAVSISVSGGATTSSTTVTVQQLASAATFSFDDRFSSVNEAIAPGLTGSAEIDISVGTGASASNIKVQVDSTTTLGDIVSDINEQSSGTLIGSLVNTSTEEDPQYALLINASQTGVLQGGLQVNVDAEITNEGIFQSSNLEQARDSQFTISGLGLITRPGNVVSDLLPGVTLELKQANTGSVSLNVTEDAEATASKLEEIVTAFNELIILSQEESKIELETKEDGSTKNVFGALARNSLDERVLSALKTAMSSSRSNFANSEVQIFADLGVTTSREGTLEFDSEKFVQAVGKDAVAAEKILSTFADEIASTRGTIGQFTEFNGLIDISLDANKRESENLNEKISRIERIIEEETTRMRRIFANLESTVAKLNAGGNAIASILSLPTPG